MNCPKCNRKLRRLGHKHTCNNPDCEVIVAFVERKGKLEPHSD